MNLDSKVRHLPRPVLLAKGMSSSESDDILKGSVRCKGKGNCDAFVGMK
jgi:hypothetical protein